jgi:putative transposase
VSEVYEFIDAEYATCPAAPAITRMCAWLEVSKSGFYEWRSRPESATAKRREELRLLIKKAFDDSDGTYGYRRVWSQLARQSVGRTGICFDNSLAESFNAALKVERVHRTAYPTRKKAREGIARYIELRYNQVRLHSALGYRTPQEALTECLNRQLAA